jgi:protein-disulfide isomerase
MMTLCTIGFFILLSLYFKGGFPKSAAQVVANQPVETVGNNQPSAPTGPVNVAVGHFPAKGKSDAPVTVIQFADFRCPFCERFFTDAEQSMIKDYVATGKVKYYFRNFAFLGPESTLAAEASECANDQGKFWDFHEWMFRNQAPESDTAYYSQDNLIKYGVGIGLNKAKFTQCLTSHKFASAVAQDLSEGQTAGVNGTPTTFVDGVAMVGAQPYASLKQAIDQALAGK